MSKSFLTYLRESSKPNNIEVYNMVKDKPEFLAIYKKLNLEPTLEDNLKYYEIENYTIREDGTIDVDDDVMLSGKNLIKIPFKFGKVTGYFSCHTNQLKTLKGSPSSVGGDFIVHTNQLTSLEGCPSSVGENFYCYRNTKEFTREEVGKVCEVKGNKYV